MDYCWPADRRLRILPNIKSAWGTVSASCSKNNHSHTCSLHHKQSDVNNSTCACVQCTSAADAHQCNTGTSKQTKDNRMAVCVIDAFALFCYDTDNRLLIGPIFIHRFIFFLKVKKVVWLSWHKSSNNENSHSYGPIKCIGEVRAPGQGSQR